MTGMDHKARSEALSVEVEPLPADHANVFSGLK